MNLERLLAQRSDLWRGQAVPPALSPGISSGFAELDARLCGRGWPRGALTEVLGDGPGAGSFALVVPALARLSRREARWILLLDPPALPYAPALAARGLDLSRLLLVRAPRQDVAWAGEQGLQSGSCSAVLIWGGKWQPAGLRRLQLAAAQGESLALLFRDPEAAGQAVPAALRLGVRPVPQGLRVEILKQRGGRPGGVVVLHP